MKKLLNSLLLFLALIFIAGCDLNINIGNNNDNDADKLNENFNNILQSYKNIDYMTVTETTNLIDFDNNNFSSIRTTNIDKNNNYFYSVIEYCNQQGVIFNVNDNFYYTFDDKSDKLYFNSNSAYKTLGFEALFDETDFRFEDNIASINITSPFSSNYLFLYDNVNLDFKTSYEYNPSILKASIKYNNNSIEYIDFDLSLIFGSFYKSVIRRIEFNFDEFEIKSLDIVNDDYLVNTASTLNTYMLEMIYEFGDSIYIKSGDFDMLIDAGQYQDGINVNSMLKEYCQDGVLDVLIATHGHADHIGGFANKALDSIDDVKLIIDYGYNDISAYEDLKDMYINNGADYYSAYECVNMQNNASYIYKFSEDLYLEVIDTTQYAENGQVLSDAQWDAENDYSVVVKLTFKNNSYLFTGDLSGQLGNKFTKALMKEDLKDITVYKAAHHGASSHYSNNQELLNYLNPEICISSAAIINMDIPYDHSVDYDIIYQHPRPAFVRWILNTPKISKTKKYYFTGTMGTIHICDNGLDIPVVTGFGPQRGYYINGIKVTGENNLKFSETKMYKGYYLS